MLKTLQKFLTTVEAGAIQAVRSGVTSTSAIRSRGHRNTSPDRDAEDHIQAVHHISDVVASVIIDVTRIETCDGSTTEKEVQ